MANPQTNNIMVYVCNHWKDFIKYGFDIQLSGHTHGETILSCKFMGGKVFPIL